MQSEDCAPNHTCAGWTNNPELGRFCIPTGWHTNADCPVGARCDEDKKCTPLIEQECRDGNAYRVDTCRRTLGLRETCGDSPAKMVAVWAMVNYVVNAKPMEIAR